MTPAALLRVHPDELLQRLAASGLRGRGGGWFPAARKWQAVRVEGGEPVVIANGAEGEPGSHKDRVVMRRQPAAVVEGLVLAARAVGAREAIVFLKGSFAAPAAALRPAIAAADTDGVAIRICHGDDSYVTGEETALLEALEGRRAWPRPKPPLPVAVGLNGRPTLVQNVETLARVPRALADPEGYRRDETTLVTVWGDVLRPGVYEATLGRPLRDVLALAGGATEPPGLLFPGGPAATPLGGDGLALPLDADALREAGSGLGTAAMLVLGASACPLAAAASVARFYERESCGQCPPCCVGSASLARVIGAFESGGARPRDLRDLDDVAGFMSGHGYCAHSRGAATVASGLVRLLAKDVAAHVEHGGCPAPALRHPDPFAAGSPERAALEQAVEAQLS